jgi:hypothetical protein
MNRNRPWQVLVVAAHWPGEPSGTLLQAASAASDLAEVVANTRLLYPHGSLPGKGSGRDPFALLEVEPDFGLVGLPAPGWTARTRRIGFAFNAFLYVSVLSGPQLLLVSDRLVWSWLGWFLRRRRKRLVLELTANTVVCPAWERAAARADAVVAGSEVQFEVLVNAGIETSRIFLTADRKAMARHLLK